VESAVERTPDVLVTPQTAKGVAMATAATVPRTIDDFGRRCGKSAP